MNRKFLFWSVVMACCAGSVLTSCSDDTVPENSTPDAPGTGAGTYVVAATVDGVNYLLTAESLDEGSVTVKNNGLETETGTYWVFHNNDYLFRLVYNKGGDGTGSSYILNSNNKLEEHLSYAFKRITTYGTWGDNVITASTGDTDRTDAGGYAEQGILVNYLNSLDGTTSTKTYPCENYLGNGEYVTFSGFVQANGKLYTSVIPMGMSQYGVKAFPDKVTDPQLVATVAREAVAAVLIKKVLFLLLSIPTMHTWLFTAEMISAVLQRLLPLIKSALPADVCVLNITRLFGRLITAIFMYSHPATDDLPLLRMT